MGLEFNSAVSILTNELTRFAQSKTPVKDNEAEKDKAISGLVEALKDGVLTNKEFTSIQNQLTEMLKSKSKVSEPELAKQVKDAMFSVLGESVKNMVQETKSDDSLKLSDVNKHYSLTKAVKFNVDNIGDKLRVTTSLVDEKTGMSVSAKSEAGISGAGVGGGVQLGSNVILESKVDTNGKIQSVAKLGPLDINVFTHDEEGSKGGGVQFGPFKTGIAFTKETTDTNASFNSKLPGIPVTAGVDLNLKFSDKSVSPSVKAGSTISTDILKKEGINLGLSTSIEKKDDGVSGQVMGTITINLD